MRGFATGVGVEAGIGVPPPTRLSFTRTRPGALEALRKSGGSALRRGQGPVQVFLYVFGVLQSHRQAHLAVGDAHAGAFFRLQALVRRGGGMGDQALGVAQVVGNVDQLQGVEEAEGALAPAFDVEGDQGAAVASSTPWS